MALTTAWDRVITSTPLNKDAAVARDGKGETYTPRISPTTHRWEGPPQLKRIDPAILASTAGFAPGKRFGRLLVLGVWAGSNPKKNSVWVCRCDCGAYEGHKARALGLGNVDRCDVCRDLQRLQMRGRA